MKKYLYLLLVAMTLFLFACKNNKQIEQVEIENDKWIVIDEKNNEKHFIFKTDCYNSVIGADKIRVDIFENGDNSGRKVRLYLYDKFGNTLKKEAFNDEANYSLYYDNEECPLILPSNKLYLEYINDNDRGFFANKFMDDLITLNIDKFTLKEWDTLQSEKTKNMGIFDISVNEFKRIYLENYDWNPEDFKRLWHWEIDNNLLKQNHVISLDELKSCNIDVDINKKIINIHINDKNGKTYLFDNPIVHMYDQNLIDIDSYYTENTIHITGNSYDKFLECMNNNKFIMLCINERVNTTGYNDKLNKYFKNENIYVINGNAYKNAEKYIYENFNILENNYTNPELAEVINSLSINYENCKNDVDYLKLIKFGQPIQQVEEIINKFSMLEPVKYDDYIAGYIIKNKILIDGENYKITLRFDNDEYLECINYEINDLYSSDNFNSFIEKFKIYIKCVLINMVTNTV